MTRRCRTHIPVIGLTASLLAGCLTTSAERVPQTASPSVEAVSPATPAAPSNYHAHVVEPLPAESQASVEQVRCTPTLPPPEPVVVPKEPPPPPEAPLVQALRCVLERQPKAALDLLQRYDPLSREVLQTFFQLAALLSEGGLEHASPEETIVLQEQLMEVQAALCKRAPLKIEKMCFCREIRNFGKYDPLPPDYAFQTGSDGRPGERVQVYVEVRNFICRPCGMAAYETALQGRVEIHDLHGDRIGPPLNFQYNPDRSRTPRQDYYLAFLFNVPPGLHANSTYTLWVYVTDVGDENVKRVSRRSLDFRVHPPRRGSEACIAKD